MDTPSNLGLRFPNQLAYSRSVSADSKRNATSLKRSTRSRKDMSTFSFTLTLLLLGTIGAAQTDNPMLKGPHGLP
jgi:hypothetical protein